MKFFFSNWGGKKKEERLADDLIGLEQEKEGASDGNAELAAVIALALQLYLNNQRQVEHTVITIQKVMKPYSPWSSKIYGLRQQPLRWRGK